MATKWDYRGGLLTAYDTATHERNGAMAPYVYSDDFLGAGSVVIPAAGAAESGVDWVAKIVGAAPPTVAGVADAAGGVIACTLTNANQKQDAVLYHGDQRGFDLTTGLAFEARIRVQTLPTDVAECVWGLLGDWIDGPDNATYSCFFTADGSGEIFCEADDNATDSSATSGVTVTAAAWHIYRIEIFSVSNILFYIDGNRVAAGTTFPYAATGANAILQPYFAAYKGAGAGVGTLYVDSVKIWGKRA